MRRATGIMLAVAGLLLAAGFPAVSVVRPFYVPVPLGGVIVPAGWLLLVAGVILLVPTSYRR